MICHKQQFLICFLCSTRKIAKVVRRNYTWTTQYGMISCIRIILITKHSIQNPQYLLRSAEISSFLCLPLLPLIDIPAVDYSLYWHSLFVWEQAMLHSLIMAKQGCHKVPFCLWPACPLGSGSWSFYQAINGLGCHKQVSLTGKELHIAASDNGHLRSHSHKSSES